MTPRSEGVGAAEDRPNLQTRFDLGARNNGGSGGPARGAMVADPDISDPVGLFHHLVGSGRFHRDTGLGRMFHPGSVSLRENVDRDSLHIVIHDDRITAHVDRVSPLRLRPAGLARYSLRRAALHNLSGMAQDVMRLLRGRQGDHRSELDCQWAGPSPPHAGAPTDHLEPTSAWSFHLEVRVAGVLEEEGLRRALTEVFGRRPPDHDALRVVDCPDDQSLAAARSQLHAAPPPRSAWPPLYALVARHPGGDALMLNINHAASDGFGALRILRSLAQAYAGGTGHDPPLDFLAAADLPVHPTTFAPSRPRAWSRSALEWLRDRLAKPVPIAPEQAVDDPGYGFHLLRLTADETGRIVDTDRPGTTRNILLAGLHLALGEWNLHHDTPSHQIGVLVQINLRPPDWQEETVGNLSVTARVSTSRRHRRGPASVLAAVTSQTTRNKRTRSGIALIGALQRTGLLPLWAKQSLVVLQPLTLNRLVDTAMMTNLGSLEEPPSFGARAGETVGVWLSAPSRAPLGVCIGALTVQGRLHVAVRFPNRLFGTEAAQRFAEGYLNQVVRVAESRSSAGVGMIDSSGDGAYFCLRDREP